MGWAVTRQLLYPNLSLQTSKDCHPKRGPDASRPMRTYLRVIMCPYTDWDFLDPEESPIAPPSSATGVDAETQAYTGLDRA